MKEMKVFSGSANQKLAKDIVDHLNIPLSQISIERLKDSEIYVKIEENVRGVDVFVIQPLCRPVNDNFVELTIMIDAIKRASAARITAVIPYFGYARQDRKTSGREPITAKLIANLLVSAGLDRVLTIDLHSDQIQGFFDIPLDHLTAISLFTDHIKKQDCPNPVIVSPDLGSVKRVRKIADLLDLPFAILDKVRKKPNVVTKVNLLGDVRGKTAILIDDMIDTAGTLCNAAYLAEKEGAKSVTAAATHGVLSDPALDRLKEAPIKELIITDTIFVKKEKQLPNMKIVSVANVFAEAIKRIHNGESVSALFDL